MVGFDAFARLFTLVDDCRNCRLLLVLIRYVSPQMKSIDVLICNKIHHTLSVYSLVERFKTGLILLLFPFFYENTLRTKSANEWNSLYTEPRVAILCSKSQGLSFFFHFASRSSQQASSHCQLLPSWQKTSCNLLTCPTQPCSMQRFIKDLGGKHRAIF